MKRRVTTIPLLRKTMDLRNMTPVQDALMMRPVTTIRMPRLTMALALIPDVQTSGRVISIQTLATMVLAVSVLCVDLSTPYGFIDPLSGASTLMFYSLVDNATGDVVASGSNAELR